MQTSIVLIKGLKTSYLPRQSPPGLVGDKEYIFRKNSEKGAFFSLQIQSNKEQTRPEAEPCSLCFDIRPMPFLSSGSMA